MKKLKTAAAIFLVALISSTANGAVVEFNMPGMLVKDVIGQNGFFPFAPRAPLTFDADSMLIEPVAVSTANVSYALGTYNIVSVAYHLSGLGAAMESFIRAVEIDVADLISTNAKLCVGGGSLNFAFLVGAASSKESGNPFDPPFTAVVYVPLPLVPLSAAKPL